MTPAIEQPTEQHIAELVRVFYDRARAHPGPGLLSALRQAHNDRRMKLFGSLSLRERPGPG